MKEEFSIIVNKKDVDILQYTEENEELREQNEVCNFCFFKLSENYVNV